jgi:hypothetical protein
MARTLTFTLGDRSFAVGVDKVDRKKLYGFRKRQVIDDQNRPLKLGLLCEDGKTLLGPGGVAMTYLDSDGDWVERGALTAVDEEGRPLPLIPSSYDGAIRLSDKVSDDEVAALCVRDVLVLGGSAEADALKEALGDDVYRFTYCYRADYHGETAYLLRTSEGLFALVGEPVPYRFVGLNIEAAPAAEDEGDELAEDEDLDFGMM